MIRLRSIEQNYIRILKVSVLQAMLSYLSHEDIRLEHKRFVV